MPKEPIAIIGIGCRLPGADNPQEFWRLLCEGRDAITEIPSSRWNMSQVYDPDPSNPDKLHTRWGGFLNNIDHFDPHFFGITPREVHSMDPRQRILLELAWEVMEDAGQVPKQLSGSQTGVFLGVAGQEYGYLTWSHDPYGLTGNASCIAANRISYVFNFRGPSLAVDTACSSSLVAVHMACQSLWNQDSTLAIAGGAQVLLDADVMITLSKAGFLSPDGRCKAFDAQANGYVRSEGAGLVLLKPLSQAQQDGDRIYAVILGGAVNQDGRSNGLSAPNPEAQEAVLRAAYQQAGVSPADVQYVEAHGTGTKLGDPIELKALGAVVGEGRAAGNVCVVGAVKTNVGHSEIAAGITGLIKVVLSLKHQQIPPSLHLKEPNPYIDFEGLELRVQQTLEPWPMRQQPALAGVSSFGFGGTNAHLVVQEAPAAKASHKSKILQKSYLLTLSAKNESALQVLADRYRTFLLENPLLSLVDLCTTASTKRSHFNHRLAVWGTSNAELQAGLAAFERDPTGMDGFIQGKVASQKVPRIAFLFTGQGSQYIGMGRELYETQPLFRQQLDRCAEILRPLLEKPLLSILYPEAEDTSLDETAYTQPALFALEYALAQLWMAWGIKPAVVMGHSVGEYVAACIAGVFSLEDGLKLIAARGRLMQALPQNGAMAAAWASEEQVHSFISPYGNAVAIAALNGPKNTVISGEREVIASITSDLEAEGIKVTPLKVSHAFHSALMEPMVLEFAQIAAEITYARPQLNLISNLTGNLIGAEIATPEYWCLHVRQPVNFAASMQALSTQGYQIFLEVGPKPVLLGMAKAFIADDSHQWLPSLRPERSDAQQLLHSLGQLYLHNIEIDWSSVFTGRTTVELPTYPFQRQRYWWKESELKGFQSTHSALKNDTADFVRWLYEIQWKPSFTKALPTTSVSQSVSKTEPSPHRWIIFAESEQGQGKKIATLLQQQGKACKFVFIDRHYSHPKPDTYTLDPACPDQFHTLWENLTAPQQPPIEGIIHLWSLVPVEQPITLDGLSQAQLRGCGSTLHLVQALLKKFKDAALPKLWLITQGSQAIGANPEQPMEVHQAALWGLQRTLELEHPEIQCGCLDLDPKAKDEDFSSIITDLCVPESEHQIAYREGTRYVARLQRIEQKLSSDIAQTSVPIAQAEATYLITGGLGALGLQMAQWLVDKGAKHLVLLGRRKPSDASQAVLDRLKQQDVQVITSQTDIGQVDEVQDLFADIQKSLPPLRGIIHAAGVLDDGLLASQDWQRFQQVMAPKIAGTWNLHTSSLDCSLDFFVCFSSFAAMLGAPGQANYAAANTFMDGFAHYRRQLGLPCLSINWGPWGGSGMAADLDDRNAARLALSGITPLDSACGLSVLEHLLSQNATQVGVLHINWARFKQQWSNRETPPFLSLLVTEVIADSQIPLAPSAFRQELAAAPPEEHRGLLIQHICTQVAKVTGSSLENIDPQGSFMELGLDSLTVMELNNRLQASLQCSLPIAAMMDYPTVEALAEYLEREVLGAGELNAEIPDPAAKVPTQVLETVHSEVTLDSSNGVSQIATPNETRNGSSPSVETPIFDASTIPAEFFEFHRSPEYLNIKQQLEQGQRIGNPYYMLFEGIAANTTCHQGQELINYASYNYVGLSGDLTVSEATKAAIDAYGTSVSASRMASGERPIHRELEEAIAAFVGTEDCVVYIGGHPANVTSIGHLFGKNDLILYDELSHNSIQVGCKLSGATLIQFPHNNTQVLEQILSEKRLQFEKALIVIEGVYSGDGDIAPLPEFIVLKQRYKTFLMIDEAHSIGVLGKTGRGIGEHFGVDPTTVDLWMGTLSKSMASCGGYIAATTSIVEYLKYTSPGFVYSVGMTPPNTASALAALKKLQTEPERIAQLHHISQFFLTLAKEKDLNTGNSNGSPIIPIIVGESVKAAQLSKAMLKRGINVLPMIYPSVPYDGARLRFFLSSTHTEDQIRQTIDILLEELAKLEESPLSVS